jgi:hypothetical protein
MITEAQLNTSLLNGETFRGGKSNTSRIELDPLALTPSSLPVYVCR